MKHIIELGPVVVGIVIALLIYIQRNRDLLRLWIAYDTAKLSGEKMKALELGRAFFIRKKGKLTRHDEEIIEGDLNIFED